MIVPNILSGLTDLISLGKRNETSESAATAPAKLPAVEVSQPPSPTAAMREILSHYDMTDITPNDYSKLLQQLFDKGTISQKDFQELSAIRIDLENAGKDPDDSVNLLEFYQQKMARLKDDAAHSPDPAAAQSNISLLVGRMNWLQKFAAVRQQNSSSGVNAVA